MRYISPSVQRFFGYAPHEMVGVTSLDFVHPDDQQVLAEVFERAGAEPGAPHTCEYRARHKDGTWRMVEAFALNLLDDPAVEGIVITGSDITQRRALESRLVQAERLEAIGQLAGGVAHDFNNILLVIRGYSSVLRGSLEDPQQIDDVEEIIKAADRAADLTRQLLAFGRRQVLQPRLLSLVEVVRGVESLLRRSLREDLDLALELDDGVAPVDRRLRPDGAGAPQSRHERARRDLRERRRPRLDRARRSSPAVRAASRRRSSRAATSGSPSRTPAPASTKRCCRTSSSRSSRPRRTASGRGSACRPCTGSSRSPTAASR